MTGLTSIFIEHGTNNLGASGTLNDSSRINTYYTRLTINNSGIMYVMESIGIKPIIKPIRGGTDGSQLSYMGLPCPNIFAGGHNFHGKYEYVPAESMVQAVGVIVKIAEITAAKA